VLILLHGHGASKSDLEPLAEELAAAAAGWSFVLPNAPQRVGITGRSWFPRISAESHSALQLKVDEIRAEAREVVFEILEDLAADGVARNRIYVGGFSQGATVALDVVASEQGGNDVGGLVSLSGGAFDVDLESLRDRAQMRDFVSHGRGDQVLSVVKSRRLSELLEKNGHEVVFIEFAGGHQIPREVIESLIEFLQYDEAG